MNIHFIAIGGSAMHNLALALHKEGHHITGSDDEIFEPSRSRLAAAGILPEKMGWNSERITSELDAIILGMHAHADNPELLRAQELNLKIYSYPGFLYEQTKHKTRAVIGGSHGKTSITSMVLHALKQANLEFDYMVGALVDGFDLSVAIRATTSFAVFEGDEYLSSALDRRPKFHLYQPHIALISGVAWDHMNVFPTYDNYLDQFNIFIDLIEPKGTLVYCEEDPEVKRLVERHPRISAKEIKAVPYGTPAHTIESGLTYLTHQGRPVPLQVFGRHNLQNLAGAQSVCTALGVTADRFIEAMTTFKGAARRLEKLHDSESFIVYRDFAHAPSKLKATTAAVKEQHPEKQLIACMELHTYSSLNKAFLDQYEGALDAADAALVYFSPEVVERKRLEKLEPNDILNAFKRDDLTVATENAAVQSFIESIDRTNTVLLLMSSGNWGGGIKW